LKKTILFPISVFQTVFSHQIRTAFTRPSKESTILFSPMPSEKAVALPAATARDSAFIGSSDASHPDKNPATEESPAPTELTTVPFGASA
jgi:hypothetical protein